MDRRNTDSADFSSFERRIPAPFNHVYIFPRTRFVIRIVREWHGGRKRVYSAERAKGWGGKGDVRDESYREWRTLAQKTLNARARTARGTPVY